MFKKPATVSMEEWYVPITVLSQVYFIPMRIYVSSENTEVYPVRSAGILRSLTGGYVFYESGTHLMNEYEVQDDHVTNSIEIER